MTTRSNRTEEKIRSMFEEGRITVYIVDTNALSYRVVGERLYISPNLKPMVEKLAHEFIPNQPDSETSEPFVYSTEKDIEDWLNESEDEISDADLNIEIDRQDFIGKEWVDKVMGENESEFEENDEFVDRDEDAPLWTKPETVVDEFNNPEEVDDEDEEDEWDDEEDDDDEFDPFAENPYEIED